MPSESYPDNAEMDATLALMHLARTDKWNLKKSTRQKRTRPLSVADNSIPEELKGSLAHQYNVASAPEKLNSFSSEPYGLDEEVPGKSMRQPAESCKANGWFTFSNQKANSSVFSRPDLVKNLTKPTSSSGSQAGARKKPKSHSREASWMQTSPLVF